MTISATGPFRAPASVTLVASITHPDNVEVSHIDFFCGANFLGSATTEPYQVTPVQTFNADKFLIQTKAYDANEHEIAAATTQFDVLPSNRYYRPKNDINRGIDVNYFSSIIAIDFQKGIELDEANDFTQKFDKSKYPWFLRIASQLNEPCYHIALDQNNNLFYKQVDTIPMINNAPVGGQPPMVAFGSQGGGSPLFVNQEYHFGIAAGGQREAAVNNDIKIEVYDKNDVDSGGYNILPVFTVNYTLPRPSNKSYWEDFLKNGSVKDYYLSTCIHGKTIDFHTQVQYPTQSDVTWGQIAPHPLLITHRANPDISPWTKKSQ